MFGVYPDKIEISKSKIMVNNKWSLAHEKHG